MTQSGPRKKSMQLIVQKINETNQDKAQPSQKPKMDEKTKRHTQRFIQRTDTKQQKQ